MYILKQCDLYTALIQCAVFIYTPFDSICFWYLFAWTHTHVKAFSLDNPAKQALEKDHSGAWDDGVAVASAGPSANHLHFAADR